jgi:divalent metal cation (Fe/Co/Zn/Cd) transporter
MDRARLERRGFVLEYLSMGWMTVEATVAVAAGLAAGSISLVGFGLDSVIEFCAAGVVIWELRGGSEQRQQRALQLIGSTFFALALYLIVEAARDLLSQARPDGSLPGLLVAASALVVMPLLARAKRLTGTALENPTLIADSAETAFCAWSSAAVLVGVGLNALFGWWWADPIAALVIAGFAIKEGTEAWSETRDD